MQDANPAAALQSTRKLMTGLLGRSIQQSRSPEMHQAEARAQGLELEYRLFDFAALKMDETDLPVFLEALEGSGYAGLNVTHPYKQAVIPLLSELSDGATRVGAVNTIAFRDGKRYGYNTDVTGFAESFRRGLPGASLDSVFQVGAGGAGAATANALLELGAKRLALLDPDGERAEQLCESLNETYGPASAEVVSDVAAAVATSSGVVNCTPVGMAGHPGTPIPADLLAPDKWVADIVYFPLQTELIRAARDRGCRVLDGGGMAVYQAAGAFEIFTGRPADSERMRAGFLATLDR